MLVRLQLPLLTKMTEETDAHQTEQNTEDGLKQPKKKAGRRVTCTEEIIEEICSAVSIGTPNKYAAIYAGVSERVFYNWVSWGEAEIARLASDPKAKPNRRRKIFVQLIQSIAEARANRVITWTDIVNRASRTDPKLALEMLARTEPEDFSPQNVVTHKVEKELEKALDALEKELDADTYAKVLSVLIGQAGGPAAAESTPTDRDEEVSQA